MDLLDNRNRRIQTAVHLTSRPSSIGEADPNCRTRPRPCLSALTWRCMALVRFESSVCLPSPPNLHALQDLVDHLPRAGESRLRLPLSRTLFPCALASTVAGVSREWAPPHARHHESSRASQRCDRARSPPASPTPHTSSTANAWLASDRTHRRHVGAWSHREHRTP